MANQLAPCRTPFARTLRRARLAAGYATAAALARVTGTTPSNVSELETTHAGRGWNTVRDLIVRGRLPLELFFPADLIREAAARLAPPPAPDSAPESSQD